MSKYTANPIEVDAWEIGDVSPVDSKGNIYVKLINGEQSKEIAASMTSRMFPSIGDYLVRTPDGYEYLNPKAVFLSKYTIIADNEA